MAEKGSRVVQSVRKGFESGAKFEKMAKGAYRVEIQMAQRAYTVSIELGPKSIHSWG